MIQYVVHSIDLGVVLIGNALQFMINKAMSCDSNHDGASVNVLIEN